MHLHVLCNELTLSPKKHSKNVMLAKNGIDDINLNLA